MKDEHKGYLRALEDMLRHHREEMAHYERGQGMSLSESLEGRIFHKNEAERLTKLIEQFRANAETDARIEKLMRDAGVKF